MARGKGEGTISKRPDGTWWARVTTGWDDEGNQKRKAFYGKTRKEVHDKMTAALNEMSMNKGRYVDPKKTTLADWLDEWLEVYKKENVRDSTYGNYHDFIRVHIKPFFKNVMLSDIKPIAVQKFANHLSAKGGSPARHNIVLQTLKQALDQAVKNDMISKNPAKDIKIPPRSSKLREVLTPDEQERFIAHAKYYGQYGEAFLIMLATGIRIGEVLALTWADVDFDNAEINVSKTLSRTFKHDKDVITKEVLGPPKTKSSTRKIPLFNGAIELLKFKKYRDKPKTENCQLFTSPKNEHPTPITYNAKLKLILRAAGIDKIISSHCLRHTFATKGLESGMELIVMQKILGHGSLKMTADLYTHVLPEKKHDSMSKLEEVIKL